MTTKTAHITIIGGAYYFERAVPKRVAHLDRRKRIRKSLGRKATTTEAEAREKAARLDQELMAFWRTLERSSGSEAELYAEAQPLAKELGFPYCAADDIAASTTAEDRRARVRKLMELTPAGGPPPIAVAAALLGGPSEPPRKVSSLLDWFFANEHEKTKGKPKAALAAWRARKQTAFRFFVECVGDVDVAILDRKDFFKWRDALFQRSERGEVKLASLNRQMNEVLGVLTYARKALGVTLPDYSGLRFSLEQEVADTPEPYEVDFIQNRFLATGALDGLNEQARRVLFVMIETGMRPSEIVNLAPENIRLEATVPHVRILPTEEARLKNKASRREIPLVGVALMAMEAQPAGFPRYRLKPDRFSAVANKFLMENGFRPTARHSVYSLRHSFELRGRTHAIPDQVWTEIFGHAFARQKYGRPSLEEKREHLLRIMLRPPDDV